MRVGSLFAGIGGFDLAARWVGWETAWFSEIEPYACRVLAKHWPSVPNHGDITAIDFTRVESVDVLCGGFPCQDISTAGKGAGIEGTRSGLWREYARAIGELRPRYVVVENVAALLGRGLERVLGDLAALGYDTEWHCIPAAAVGAPHRRDRIWIVAYPQRERSERRGGARDVAGEGGEVESQTQKWQRRGDAANDCRKALADADRTGSYASPLPGIHHGEAGAGTRNGEPERRGSPRPQGTLADALADAIRERGRGGDSERQNATDADTSGEGIRAGSDGGWWAVEPNVGRVADGIPARVDRLRGLGNAIVPQVAEVIFRAINDRERALT